MARKDQFLWSTTVCIVLSVALAQNPRSERYEGYNLERGPVFYEAYYPDSNEKPPASNYQEKRYFDRGTILERTFQVPSAHFTYADAPRVKEYAGGEQVRYLNGYPPKPPVETNFQRGRSQDQAQEETANIEEITRLVRRAITRDLESWNSLENYLDRARNQGQHFAGSRRNENLDSRGFETEIRPREYGDLVKGYSFEGVRDQRTGLPSGIESEFGTRSNVVQGLASQRLQEGSLTRDAENAGSRMPVVAPLPPEDIFQPRPQVINYVFSRKVKPSDERQVQETEKESMPRSYGDNLLQEEMKKTEKSEEKENAKVTSIEISEEPRHKTRHHHGEWPKRDYSRHRQSGMEA